MKKAFTMMELVFVIVVIGILLTIMLPRIHTDRLNEAGVQVLGHIRYTQHLAMIDDKYSSNDSTWYLGRWQISFSKANSTTSYRIFAERNGAYNGNPDADNSYTVSEVAKNPLDSEKYLIGVKDSNFANSDMSRLTTELNIGKKYGIKDFVISGGSTGSNTNGLIFDHLGRTYKGNTNDTVTSVINSPVDRLAQSPVYIKLCSDACSGTNNKAVNDNQIAIKVENETGYACILKMNSDDCI